MKISALFFSIILAALVSGCATTGVPFDRIDVFNNIEGSVMTLHDRGGDIPTKIPTGGYGWVYQNTYFGADGSEHVNDNTITGRFYDAKTGEYLGLFHWQVGAGNCGYQAFHSPYERKMLER